jgi:AraC-like DNA-binding protein
MVALESGFRDAAGLSRVFQRQVGVIPSEYGHIFAGRWAEFRSPRRNGRFWAPCFYVGAARPRIPGAI